MLGEKFRAEMQALQSEVHAHMLITPSVSDLHSCCLLSSCVRSSLCSISYSFVVQLPFVSTVRGRGLLNGVVIDTEQCKVDAKVLNYHEQSAHIDSCIVIFARNRMFVDNVPTTLIFTE